MSFAPAKAKAAQRQEIAAFASVPSPVGGWNARDSLAAMKDTDAVSLTNWFCLPSEIQVRAGYEQWATGITGQIESLMGWQSGTSANLFGAAGTNIYDVSASGAVGAAVQSSLTNAKWQHVVYELSGTTWLINVNGADKPRYYNGSAWTAIDGASTPAITGVTTTLLVDVCAHKARLWFVEKDSLNAWYLPPNAVGGAATKFPFGQLFSRGGYLQTLATWSLDAGAGMDDYFVAITSEGEVAVYRGTDPSSSSTWALVGVYMLGTPIGRRCTIKYAGDVLVITKDGLIPLSKGLMSSRVNVQVTLTNKIQTAISTATSQYGANFGWQTVLYPPENMLLLNVPVATGMQEQYVMNTITGSWSRFTGWAANCWVLFQDRIYFGGNGVTCRAWSSQADNGSNVVADVQQAFSYFGVKGKNKQWNLARPTIRANNSAAVLVGMNVDYRSEDPTGTISLTSTSGAKFGSAQFGSAKFGSGDLAVTTEWKAVEAIGMSGGLRMRVATNAGDARWVSTDYVLEEGGPL